MNVIQEPVIIAGAVLTVGGWRTMKLSVPMLLSHGELTPTNGVSDPPFLEI